MSTISIPTSAPASSSTSMHRRSPSPPTFSAKYENLVSPLPRRPPPSALRLVQGPLPHRARPKHTLPSLPRPAFYPKIHVPRTGPTPRKRAQEALVLETQVPAIHLAKVKFPELKVPGYGSESESEGSDSESEGSTWSRRSSIDSVQSVERRRSTGDIAGGVAMAFNVTVALTAPKKVAVHAVQRV
ncbi:hypothetical protein EIP91_011296 [Steccherinum ochraceum]|uniref:Uncharacterized protein n=1 Tax=Steccherinum ochraceum TaxID=92696 RepID=A0A4V2MX04_9APHY|nr:hypothetical protein EIP91_011296 [Steccherinum ochraceum]